MKLIDERLIQLQEGLTAGADDHPARP
jgi:hypothetical protein